MIGEDYINHLKVVTMLANNSRKISMEDMMAKLLKRVESINVRVREMKTDLLTMSQLVDSHSTFIKNPKLQ